MASGCLTVFFGLVAKTFFRLGTWLGAVLVSCLVFLLLAVAAPLCLGMTRQVLRWVLGTRRASSGDEEPGPTGNRLAYGLAGGVLWTGIYVALRTAGPLVRRLLLSLVSAAAPDLPSWTGTLLVLLIFFTIGATIGALAHRHEQHSYRS